ncbi:MAG: hypothetical protein ACI93R_004248 [Flavobacteriales bacterium]|jgi:hypothetical protein
MSKLKILSVLSIVISLVACSAEVGSDKWCESLDDKAKGEWTLNETKDYARHCIL